MKFNPRNLEKILQEKVGDLKLSELMKPCLITTYNMVQKSSFFFRSKKEDTDRRDFYMRDILRSTSAAPTYFPPAKIKNLASGPKKDPKCSNMINLDGGVFANNPTMCAYAEARNTNFEDRDIHEPSASEMHILSIGTGGGGFKIDQKEKSDRWSLLKWAQLIPEIMMDGSIDTVAFQMNEIFQAPEAHIAESYLRVDTPEENRTYASDMSNASPENINNLKKAGDKTLEYAKSKGLDMFLDKLLD